MEKEVAKEVLTVFERLSDDDKNSISIGLKTYYGKQIKFSMDELSKMDQEELETIKSIIVGIIITKENAPDILMVHVRLKDNNLPSKISFGKQRLN
ncbi:hypothetical protein [Paenibacillus sp. V4I7]|uniref:hypothetical protein n=1 Tax=Paenibacillus sp. V4I7 TaxID=3042307 RepID=UPI002787E6C9|nr:hypothetical protein [Paenibacillus sp. V4I7]MDQ0897746.1 hypothetical protein [Paenibacillus sp. V4I7]